MAGLRSYLAAFRATLGQLLGISHNCDKKMEWPNSLAKGPNWNVLALSKESIWLDSDCTWLLSGDIGTVVGQFT